MNLEYLVKRRHELNEELKSIELAIKYFEKYSGVKSTNLNSKPRIRNRSSLRGLTNLVIQFFDAHPEEYYSAKEIRENIPEELPASANFYAIIWRKVKDGYLISKDDSINKIKLYKKNIKDETK